MKIGQDIQTVKLSETSFDMRRTPDGLIEIWGKDEIALATAMGFAHAMDRMLQMMLVRLVGQGCLCECLFNNEENLTFDRLMLGMRFSADAHDDVANLSKETRCLVDNYCQGVNFWLENYGYPWEFRLVSYHPEPWTVSDCLLTSKVMSYVTLAESQQFMEGFIIQRIRADVDTERLKELFHPHLAGLTKEIIELIKKINNGPFPPDFPVWVPMPKGSNNWAVSGQRTASGSPFECHDPHLEVNRLPAVWYEFIQHAADNFRIGVTIPGIPFMIMGRTRDVSFGFTYGFMDMVDYFIEEVRGGRYRRQSGYEDFTVHTEVILRKHKSPANLEVWETHHGVLEVPPDTEKLEDGYYLCRAWSAERQATALAFNALSRAIGADTVPELQRVLAEASVSCNWVMADSKGNIGYQQSGRLPLRQHSGLYPVPGWEERYEWKGYATGDQLARITNPPRGYIATANNDMNEEGKPLSINLPMGPYRAERICQLLEQRSNCTVEDMKLIQQDRYSLQAEKFMQLLFPVLPHTSVGDLLREWDFRYLHTSRPASLFEDIYSELLEEVFGKGLFGVEAWRHAVAETGVLADFYYIFDKVLLGDGPSWLAGDAKKELLQAVVDRVFQKYPNPESVPTWGSRRQITMTHLFFGGRLPRFLGLDYGPVALEGNRATIVQGAIYKSLGRTTTFAPSYRFITDLAGTKAHTVLAGGPSDRRFSKYYMSDVLRWLNYDYKVLVGE